MSTPRDGDNGPAPSPVVSGAPPPPDPPVGPARRLRSNWTGRLAAVALVLSAPIASWRVLGPNPGNEYRNNPQASPDDWDYLMPPPDWDPALERAIGWGGVVAFLAAALLVVVVRHRRVLDRIWIVPLLAVTIVGLGLGAAQRVLTSAVVGANIGGGFILLFGVPTAVVLVGLAVFRTIVIVRTTVPVIP